MLMGRNGRAAGADTGSGWLRVLLVEIRNSGYRLSRILVSQELWPFPFPYTTDRNPPKCGVPKPIIHVPKRMAGR